MLEEPPEFMFVVLGYRRRTAAFVDVLYSTVGQLVTEVFVDVKLSAVMPTIARSQP